MTVIRVGQIWQEYDPRFPNVPPKEVRGVADDGRIIIGLVGWLGGARKVKRERFNGKRGGYRLIRDVEAPTQEVSDITDMPATIRNLLDKATEDRIEIERLRARVKELEDAR